MTRLRLLCLVLLLGACDAYAGSLDLNLNDDAVRLTFTWPSFGERLEVDAGWLHHQDEGDVASLGLHVAGITSAGSTSLDVGVGGKAFYVDANRMDGSALGIGGFVRFRIPGHDRLGLAGQLYFAPNVVAFGDLERYLELDLGVSYDILDRTHVYLGYRLVDTDFEAVPGRSFDSSLHVGLRLVF